MADIVLTCPKCAAETKISEYITEKSVSCSACGQDITLPEKEKQKSGLKLRKTPEPSTRFKEQEEEILSEQSGTTVSATAAKREKKLKKLEKGRLKVGTVITIASWIIFIILGAALSYIRFYGGIPEIDPANLKQYGLITVGVCYLVIIIIAIKDNMFDGLLCIIVPLYPFYYILNVSSLVLVRAIVAAILVAFGYDTVLLLQTVWDRMYQTVNQWIQNV